MKEFRSLWVFGEVWGIFPGYVGKIMDFSFTPEKFNIPGKWWLEDKPLLLGPGNFSGAFAVSLREGLKFLKPINPSTITEVQKSSSNMLGLQGSLYYQPIQCTVIRDICIGVVNHLKATFCPRIKQPGS